MQGRNRDTDRENKRMDTKGANEGGGNGAGGVVVEGIGRLGPTCIHYHVYETDN